MTFHLLTIFPKIFNSYLNESIIKRAQKKKLIKIKPHNLRDFANDERGTVDDRPYGGGFGMVLMVEPIYRAVRKIKNQKLAPSEVEGSKIKNKIKKSKVILLSAKGKKFDQKIARRFSKLDQLIIICGRYEGVDERVAKHIADEEISIGEYVLTGGELPAMVIIDAVSRLIPGVIKKGSLKEESFSLKVESRKLKAESCDSREPKAALAEYPHYTRPEIILINGKKRRVPKVLLSGHHQKIADWRRKQMI